MLIFSLPTTIFILSLLLPTQGDALYFMRNITCIQPTQLPLGCNRWNQTTKMYFYIDYFNLCLPKHTRVLTHNGPKTMEKLQMGEEILTYNHQTGLNEFKKIIAWISRDGDAITKFTKVMLTDERGSFMVSSLHNVAVKINKYGIGYKFASELLEGETLQSFPAQNVSVGSVQHQVEGMGLFSVLTWNSNFYIIVQSQHVGRSQQMMVLMHSYSQIRDPVNYQVYVTPFLYLSSFVQNYEHEHYFNTAYTKLKYIIGGNWINQNNTVKYDITHELTPPTISFSNTIVKKGSSGGHGGSHYHSSSSNSRSRYHSKKKRAVKLFSMLSIMKNAIFNV